MAVASFKGGDDISHEYVLRLLVKAGIRSSVSGSLVATVHVASSDAEAARQAIGQASGLREFVALEGSPIPEERGQQMLERKWERSVNVGNGLDEVLRTYGPETEIGKIVRRALAGYEEKPQTGTIVRAVQWSHRPFVTKDLLPTTAIEATVELVTPDGPVSLDASVLPE